MEQDLETLVRFLKTVAHESRLRLLGLLASREYSVGELAELLDLREPTISHHLTRLQELDLVRMRVEGTAHRYRLKSDTLQRFARELLTTHQMASIAADTGGAAWAGRVLATYLVEGRLTKIPETRKKREVILRWLVTQFAEDRRYTEAEVNEIIKRHHPDTATLRRELVSNNLMGRESGVYWRVPVAAGTGEGQPRLAE